MAKGYDTNRRRADDLNMLGRELARRSGSKCELCKAAGVKLNVAEVKASSEVPDIMNCVFICDECYRGIDNPSKMPEHWRCLSISIWSETEPVKLISAKVLRNLSEKHSWASDVLEEVYFDEDELNIIDG